MSTTDVARRGHRDRCAITGIGAHDVLASDSGVSDLTLALAAGRAAIADAGLRPADIDGIVRNDMDLVTHNALADGARHPRPARTGASAGPGDRRRRR